MVDKKVILEQFHGLFDTVENTKVTVNNAGKIVVTGSVIYKGNTTLPNGELPFEFATVTKNLSVRRAGLKNLKGLPPKVGGFLSLRQNLLTDLSGCPQSVGRYLDLREMPNLISLEGFPVEIKGWINIDWKPNLPLLRTLFAPEGVDLHPSSDLADKCQEILQKYVGKGRRAIHLCAKELIAAGFEGNARW